MKSKWGWTILLVTLGAAVYVGTVFATPASQFTGTTLAKAQLDELNIKGNSKPDHWKIKLKTKGLSDLYVQLNVWSPGGSTGWHTHPGPSLITVTAGLHDARPGEGPSLPPPAASAGGAQATSPAWGGASPNRRTARAAEPPGGGGPSPP